jgi:hypothetical protein
MSIELSAPTIRPALLQPHPAVGLQVGSRRGSYLTIADNPNPGSGSESKLTSDVPNRRVAALCVAVVGDHALGGLIAVEQQVATHEMEILVADRLMAPQRFPNRRVQAVGTYKHVRLYVVAPLQMHDHCVATFVKARDSVVCVQDAGGEGVEHPLVQPRAQESDESPAVFRDDLVRKANVGAELSAVVDEERVHGRAEVARIDAEQAQDLLGRWPQVEDVPGGLDPR